MRGANIAKADYIRREKECNVAFQDKASMTKFPFPPLPRCTTNPSCIAYLKFSAPAYQDNVKHFLQRSALFSRFRKPFGMRTTLYPAEKI